MKNGYPSGQPLSRFRQLFSIGRNGAIASIDDFIVRIVIAAAAITIVAIAVTFIIATAKCTKLITEQIAEESHNADEGDDTQDNTKDSTGFLVHNNTPFYFFVRHRLAIIIHYIFRFVNSFSVIFKNYSSICRIPLSVYERDVPYVVLQPLDG